MPYHGEELLHDEQRDEPVWSLAWTGQSWVTTTMLVAPNPPPSPACCCCSACAAFVHAPTKHIPFFFLFLACCCPFGHVFSAAAAAALIFCHAPLPADCPPLASLSLPPVCPCASWTSVYVGGFMSSLREMCVADEGKHCPVSCLLPAPACCPFLSPAPSPLSMHNVLASFEIYVALVSWFIFWWPLFTSMTINCHCPSVFMSLGHE